MGRKLFAVLACRLSWFSGRWGEQVRTKAGTRGRSGTCGRRREKVGKIYHDLFTDIWDDTPSLCSALVDLFPLVHLTLHYH